MATHKAAIHILYGVPCVGKSTGAVAFAHHAGIRSVVQTDYLREVQRAYAVGVPVLGKVTHNAWELYGPPTAENIVVGFVDHVAAVAPAVARVVTKLVGDGFDAIVEGAHFHSGVIAALRRANPGVDIQATLLVVPTARELRERAEQKRQERVGGGTRKLWRERIAVMVVIQDFLVADAQGKDIEIRTVEEWRQSWRPSRTPSLTWTTS